MKAITKASRINTMTQVIQHMNSGLTVVEACRIVDISRRSFNFGLEKNREAEGKMLSQ
jgi:hypothetical protein